MITINTNTNPNTLTDTTKAEALVVINSTIKEVTSTRLNHTNSHTFDEVLYKDNKIVFTKSFNPLRYLEDLSPAQYSKLITQLLKLKEITSHISVTPDYNDIIERALRLEYTNKSNTKEYLFHVKGDKVLDENNYEVLRHKYATTYHINFGIDLIKFCVRQLDTD